MSLEAALRSCEETVRRADPDRYFSALFAPEERRPLLFALYALNYELSRIGEAVREPMMGEIRLEWWREAVEGARDGRPRAHDVVQAIAEVFARSGPPLELFEAMIAARRFDVLRDASFANASELEAYANATSGNLMRIAARLLDERTPDDAAIGHAGTAYALLGILRMEPVWRARNRSIVPRGEGRASIVARALFHHGAARTSARPGAFLPALLPAALVPLYAKAMLRESTADVALYRRQWTIWRAAMRGRV